MKFIKIALLAGSIMAGFGAVPAYAGHYGHHGARLSPEEKLELRRYKAYEHREPCQNYRNPPAGFMREGCDLMRVVEKPDMMPRQAMPAEPVPQKMEQPKPALLPSIASYEILFDFDSAAIRPQDAKTLDRIALDIASAKPYEVTITGHADRAGPADYNMELSRKRAQAVSTQLTARGIANRILAQEAEGENDPAVPTPDGVREQENRRVVVDFRK